MIENRQRQRRPRLHFIFCSCSYIKARGTIYSYILTFYKIQCIESISQLGISKSFGYILNFITRYIIAQFLDHVKLPTENIDHTGGGMAARTKKKERGEWSSLRFLSLRFLSLPFQIFPSCQSARHIADMHRSSYPWRKWRASLLLPLPPAYPIYLHISTNCSYTVPHNQPANGLLRAPVLPNNSSIKN